MLDSLREQELYKSDTDLGLFVIELLVSAQLLELLLVEILSGKLLIDLHKHQLELDCTHPV